MEDRSVSVTGFPATCNDLKLRLFVEKHVGQTGIIENIDRNEDCVVFKFGRNEDLQKFLKSNLTEMLFGDETYKLTVIAVTGLSENKPTIERERGSNSRNEQGDLEFRMRKKLHVSNIPQHLNPRSTFQYHFERFGQLQNCYINDSKGIGFLTYMRHEDACNAKNNGSNVGGGRRLNIQWDRKEGQTHLPASNPGAKRHSAYGQRTPPVPLMALATTPFHSPQNSDVPRKRSQDLQTPKHKVLNGQFFKKTYYWSSLNELPSSPGTRCVLAQNIDTSVDMEIVQMYFESKKRSSGGLVENIVKMIDGLLIVFQDNKDCESCLKNENQVFEGKKLNIFSKTIPSYYGKRFTLEGVADNTSHDTLTMYLEQCSENETSPCIKQNSPGVYLVEYGDDFNIAEMDGILQKIRNKPLGTRYFKVNRLLETDCLKATGVLEEVSTDAILFLFQSEKRVSGGPVTRVDRYHNNTALIYFTSFTVAERIYQRFKKPCVESLILHQHSIEIELYFHSLANLHKNAGKDNSTASNDMDEGKDLSPTVPCPKRPLRFFSMEPKIHKNIFFFIRGNKKFVEKLKNNFSELAKVELNHSKHGIKIKFSPEKDLGLDTQDGFNVECKKRFEDFSAAFTTCSRTFDDTKLKNARSLKIHSVLDRKRKTENNDFSIRWNADKPIVDVTGLKDDVDKTIKNIEALINSVFVDMEVTEEQYRIMVCCGIIEELQKKFQNVDIKCDTDKNSITLSGPDSDVSKLQITAFQQLTKDFQKRKLTGIDASVVRYLSESMNVSKMTTTIHEKFTDNNVKGTLEWDEKEARLVVRSEDDFKKAEKVITDLINVRSIPTDKNFSDVVKSKEWNGFQQNLKKNGMCELYIKTNQCIVLVSFASELLSLEQKVKDFLDENSGEKKFFEVSYGVARYIVETSKEFSSGSCEKKKIKCGLAATNRKRIFIEGKKKDCLNAGANMAHLIQNVKERKYTLHDPGIKEYYESSEGKEFLESNERLNNCIILASTHQFCNRIQQPQPSQFQSQSQNLTSGLSVKLVQGDILKQTADVIVNVTNTQGIQGSAISRALVKIAGVGVQTEFSLLPQPIKVGNVYETNAGNLSCKKIYHSIVTEYDPLNSEAIIQLIVKRCLHTADKAGFRSISFPAIATGGFNHPPASVALWMRNEISRFKSNSLKDVIIVLYPSNHATISAFDAEFNNPSSHGSTSPSSSMNYGPLNISVYQGDITREHSDAIVNSAGSNFDLSQAGALSQAILSKGGNTIQVEVFNSSGSNFRKSSGGNLPCRVIIHIATSNNEKDITKKLLIALEEADRTGITSISIPALATGGHALKSASVAQAMKEAFDDFAKTQVSNLKTINVVVFDLAQLNDFKVGILSNQQTVFSKIKEKQSAIFQKFISSSANVTFDLYFYSTDSGAIDKAIDNVTKETKKVVSSQSIQNDAFDRLTDLEMLDIMQICKDNRVSIADKSTKYYKQFAFEGLTDDVNKAKEAVNKVLTEFCAAETSALYVTWQTFRNGNWDDCPIQANHILEKAFKARNGNNTNPTLNLIQIPEYNIGEAPIKKTTIDLSNLEGDQHGSNPPSVRRNVKEKGADNVIPSTWEDMKGHRFLKIKLSSTTQEYITVENKFIMAGGRQTIIKIERIQNPDIYKLYITKKAEVTNKKLTSGNSVERELFHGTSDEDKILLHGFDRSYAGKHATAWGSGVYFATTASYSDHFASADANGLKRMFLANIVTGDYCVGNKDYVAPPQRPGTVKNDLYDSVVNNKIPPSIFVIFKDASAYPTYLITYT